MKLESYPQDLVNGITPEVEHLIDLALAEDQVFNDATNKAIIPPDIQGSGILKCKADGVLAGISVALSVFRRVDPSINVQILRPDGHVIVSGDVLARVEGRIDTILRGERTALNFLQRMSGVASQTALCVKAVEDFSAQIVDTRKTIPGMRYLDKYAVRMGGGHNHRMNLADGILVKDNHILSLYQRGIGLAKIVEMARERSSHTLKIEVEVSNLEELKEAFKAGANIIMLDNMSLDDMTTAVQLIGGRALLEASGGVDLRTVMAVAQTGVDLISIGSLTHSSVALDISLDLET